MEETSLRLDGNACAGLLGEVFARDMTAASGACAACGAVGLIGRQHLYDYPHGPGAVLRCFACENVLMVVVHIEGRHRFAAQGLAWLEVHGDESVQH
jgi:hypothetical protein